MRVVIAGGGNVGTFIAEELHEAGHEVLIVDNDPTRGRAGARDRTSRAGVPWLRRRRVRGQRRWPTAGLDKADVVAAVTGDDEDNLVDLAARQAGVRRAARRRPGEQPEERVDVQRDVGRRRRRVDAAPAHRARRGGGVASASLVRLLSFEGGKARLVEVTLADDSPAVDKEIVELGLPRDSTVVAVLRDDRLDRAPRRHRAAGRRRGARAGHRRVRGRRPHVLIGA